MNNKTDRELFAMIGRCVNSAADTYKGRATMYNYHALEDIESDLERGLAAVKELFRRRAAAEAEFYNNKVTGGY